MTEHLSPDLDMAHQFIRLITTKWSEVGGDLTMELRALGQRPQSIRFNPKKEEEVVEEQPSFSKNPYSLLDIDDENSD